MKKFACNNCVFTIAAEELPDDFDELLKKILADDDTVKFELPEE